MKKTYKVYDDEILLATFNNKNLMKEFLVNVRKQNPNHNFRVL